MAVFTTGGRALDRVNYVEYIQSTGTQYIDTGFVPNQDTRVVADCAAAGVNSSGTFPFGVRTSVSSKAFTPAILTEQLFYNYGEKYQFVDYGGNVYERKIIDANKNVCTFTGSDAVTITMAEATFTCDYNMVLGTAIHAGTPYGSTNGFTGKLYSCQIYDNGTLVRDFWPCLDPNGVACLYDKVDKQYYYNAGTGEFTAG